MATAALGEFVESSLNLDLSPDEFRREVLKEKTQKPAHRFG